MYEKILIPVHFFSEGGQGNRRSPAASAEDADFGGGSLLVTNDASKSVWRVSYTGKSGGATLIMHAHFSLNLGEAGILAPRSVADVNPYQHG
jgi:hypothetical protein